jgi:acetyl esterase/lipase
MSTRVAQLVGFVALLALLALPGCAGMRVRSASRDLTIVEDVAYLPDGDPKHELDLYVPHGATSLPVILFVHGGFWRGQDRRYFQAFTGIYGNAGVALARQGFAVAVQSYRLSPGVGIKDQMSDLVAALRWVEEHIASYGGDPTRVVLVGYSAGGHLATLLGLDRSYLAGAGLDASRIRGLVSISGILDVHEMATGQDASFNEEVTYRLFGRTAVSQAALSPSSFVRADAPPLLTFAAERDYPFVRAAARGVAEHLASLGARATFHDVPGHDHGDMVLNFNSDRDVLSEPIGAFAHSVADPVVRPAGVE